MRTLRILFLLNMAGLVYAQSPVLWKASWIEAFTEKNITSKAEARLFLPLDLGLRVQVIDQRPPLWMDFTNGKTAISLAAYHKTTGSRLLYGVLNEWGLPARVCNPWVKSMPFVDYRKDTDFDLKTEPSFTKSAQIALHLKSPKISISVLNARAFSALLFDGSSPLLTGGFELTSKGSSLTLESLYTSKTLAERQANTWFSEKIPLPKRNFHLYAFNAAFKSTFFAAAADWAYSETFAFGKDSYANIGIRIGEKPWRLFLSVDGAGPRYVDRDGGAVGARFRVGVRFEYYGRYSESLRLTSTLSSLSIGLPFERSSTQFYYKFSTKNESLHLSRISFEASRNASDLNAIKDTYNSALAFVWGKKRFVLSSTLVSVSESSALPAPFPIPPFTFDHAKVSGEIVHSGRTVHVAFKTAACMYEKKDMQWEISLSTSLNLGPGILSLALGFQDFPDKLSYTVSWRMDKN